MGIKAGLGVLICGCVLFCYSCASDGTDNPNSDTTYQNDTQNTEDETENSSIPADPLQACGSLAPEDYPCDTTVSTGSQLQTAVNNLGQGETICVEDGTYSTGNMFIRASNTTIRSASGNRDAVIIDNAYRESQSIFSVRAAHVTLADMTLKRSWWHGVHVAGGGDYVTLSNLHIIDAREQFVKVNPSGGQGNDYGTLRCSLFELTDTGRDFIEAHPTTDILRCYTGGIDVLYGEGWSVYSNTFENIYCDNGHLPTHMVLFWVDTVDPRVEKNKIINCARGIGFGLGQGNSHSGGIIKNNMIYDDASLSGTFDVGIGLENAENVDVFNNTVYVGHYANAIEYRFSGTTGARIYNNLTNAAIAPREGGTATLDSNNINAQDSWFVDLESGDLHLASAVSTVVNQGEALDEVADDIDGDLRDENHPDIGADEF